MSRSHSTSHETVIVIPVAASSLSSEILLRKRGSTARIDAAQGVQRRRASDRRGMFEVTRHPSNPRRGVPVAASHLSSNEIAGQFRAVYESGLDIRLNCENPRRSRSPGRDDIRRAAGAARGRSPPRVISSTRDSQVAARQTPDVVIDRVSMRVRESHASGNPSEVAERGCLHRRSPCTIRR